VSVLQQEKILLDEQVYELNDATSKLKEKLKLADSFKKKLAAADKDLKRKHNMLIGKTH